MIAFAHLETLRTQAAKPGGVVLWFGWLRRMLNVVDGSIWRQGDVDHLLPAKVIVSEKVED